MQEGLAGGCSRRARLGRDDRAWLRPHLLKDSQSLELQEGLWPRLLGDSQSLDLYEGMWPQLQEDTQLLDLAEERRAHLREDPCCLDLALERLRPCLKRRRAAIRDCPATRRLVREEAAVLAEEAA